MKAAAIFLQSLASFHFCSAASIRAGPRHPTAQEDAAIALAAGVHLADRAYPDSPSGGYAPEKVDCPSTRPTLRRAGSLSSSETAWLQKRRNNTVEPLISFLAQANISGFDAPTYIHGISSNASQLPNIGIAVSGGGYRALLNGAGFLAAADNRTINSTAPNQIGGLLQATTYLAGLSGGSWLVGSIFSNNFSSVQTLRDGSDGSSVWKFDRSIFQGPESDGISILNTGAYWENLHSQVEAKSDAGFNVSITDYWGRALSYQLINATDGGPAYTWSSIADTPAFADGHTPFPLVVSDGRAPDTTVVSLNSTLFEFNPYEMGSWDPSGYAFAPIGYLGSPFIAGSVPAEEQCVRGFDQAGYIMGTSSTLFNEFLINLNSTSIPSFFQTVLRGVLTDIGADKDDIALYQPNPFYLYNNETKISQTTELDLTDGGEDGQNIPLNPLIQPQRGVDVIFAVDSSADTNYSWPDGSSLVNTYRRSLNSSIENGTAFPVVPGQNTFINLGLNSRPTFFGCNASNTTGEAPLVVYIPNAPYITQSNVTTFTDSYSDEQRNLVIQNGFDVATMGNGTLDSQWPTCVACAVLSRSFHKTGGEVPDACTTCFDRYCWNGTVNNNDPGTYEPGYKIDQVNATSDALRSLRRSSLLPWLNIAAAAATAAWTM
ncbi:MAG: Lysophospholipase 1 [Claussenomyces sp. TS43310]|nr:MAG: Lysophospholipase 1 [Claussenomyces sp. TS43310]